MAKKDVVTELERAPLPKIVQNLAMAISDAQMHLELNAVNQIKYMADKKNGIQLGDDPEKRSLIELGFTPTFYHFGEATIEARVAFSMMETTEKSIEATVSVEVPVKMVMIGASVTAGYSNKYSFSAEGSSVISTRMVSVPPPDTLAQIMSNIAGAQKKKTT